MNKKSDALRIVRKMWFLVHAKTFKARFSHKWEMALNE